MKLEDKKTIKFLWVVFIFVLLILMGLELLVTHHPHFGVDGWMWFSPAYGLIACTVMVVFSKIIVGAVLKRKDTYYDE